MPSFQSHLETRIPHSESLKRVAICVQFFCIKEKRKITSAQTFSYGGVTYLVEKTQDYRFRTVIILTHDDGSQEFEIYGKKIQVTKINKSRTEIAQVAA